MPLVGKQIGIAAALVLGGLSLSACATRGYVDEQIEMVNGRISAVDAKATDALQRADAANAAAANAAQTAAGDSRTVNQRIDQLTTRVDTMEQQAASRRPRN